MRGCGSIVDALIVSVAGHAILAEAVGTDEEWKTACPGMPCLNLFSSVVGLNFRGEAEGCGSVAQRNLDHGSQFQHLGLLVQLSSEE